MKPARYLECLASDAARLRDAAASRLDARVPSCPDWDVAELVRHTAVVYLHKAECMRLNAFPKPWPPDGLNEEEPISLFDRAYADLIGEFDTRDPDDEAITWYTPEQTVGFWIRRMAQETVIHRVDAELAAGAQRAPIPDDLAIDGIDEVLVRFLSFQTCGWPSEFGDLLDEVGTVAVHAGEVTWSVRPTKEGVIVSDDSGGSPDATVSGDPKDVLLWLWRRSGDDAVAITGTRAPVDRVWELLGMTTQ